ncbi:hypothetical protein [Sphingobium sp. ZW T5_29]|uniref:hypothetical protein n=1 Tax=Sphingobium sp. ZW T5_29 TaxID=3378077 RepID=UPI0038525EE9
MSEEGVAIAIEGWTKSREVASLREAEDLAVTKELADAAYSSPIDVQRLKRAIVAKNAAEASRVDATTKASIDTLDKLSKLDRQIYARRFTHWQSAIPVRECWAKRAK